MKKKIVSAFLCTTMVASMLAGCQGAAQQATDAASDTASQATEAVADTAQQAADAATQTADAATQTADAAADTAQQAADAASEALDLSADTGKVLNIYCWNEEFKSRLTDHYPGYEEVDATHGKIGDVDVVWNITPSDDNAYQNNLDEHLLAQADAAEDEKIDLFLVEADYALKYVDTDYTLPVADLGITDADTADQYQYTKDIVTDSNGVLKGVSWQGCPGIMFYNRDIAAEVLGSEEPDDVQEFVKDWATFNETATKIKEAGYNVTSTTNDTYRVYSNNVSSKWVDGNTVHIDENIKKWVDDSKVLVDAKETTTAELWSDDWKKGFYGDVFAYFGPAWLVNFCMADGEEGSVATNGRWGGVVGPQSFFWGGTWICGANGTDNPALVGDIMRQLTCNADIMKDIVEKDDDFANNKTAMAQMAESGYTSRILGGQNPLPMYMEGAEKIDLSNLSEYDQGCNEEFQNAMKNYFDGNAATYEDALELFKKAITEKYPELTVE
ncbi:MAG: carbohydrate ABC transporter substrate-binding protein [Lachnospiraceae bacterium]|nr:carbohydrate ABC transporter substrate-binding protein [Lachnospiraceae bacterium]